MAYDKVVDSAQLEAAITASANAIREKTGDTALIQWLADKGFAEAIAGIKAGGAKVATGTFTVAETQLVFDYTFEHSLGETPNLFIIYNETAFDQTVTFDTHVGIVIYVFDTDGCGRIFSRESGAILYNIASSWYINNPSDYSVHIPANSQQIGIAVGSSGYCGLQAGMTYRWIAGVIE